MEDRFETSLLMEYYGALLTDKQQVIMGLYFNEDFSLAEIAELNQTSRQAIHDLIKRTSGQLLKYEEKLGMKKAGEDLEEKKQLLMKRLDQRDNLDEDLRQFIHGI